MTEWIIQFIQSFGYVGIVALMLAENVFPPIPSELIMPFAGFVAARGDLQPVGVLLAGVFGSVAGTLPWYWAGRRIGRRRLKKMAEHHGRWLTLSPEDLEQAEDWFHEHGGRSVLLGRVVPGIRTVISMPAGIEKMALPVFLLWSTIGSLVWVGGLMGVGYVLEANYEKASGVLEWATRIIVGGLIAWYVWRVVTFGRGREGKDAGSPPSRG